MTMHCEPGRDRILYPIGASCVKSMGWVGNVRQDGRLFVGDRLPGTNFPFTIEQGYGTMLLRQGRPA